MAELKEHVWISGPSCVCTLKFCTSAIYTRESLSPLVSQTTLVSTSNDKRNKGPLNQQPVKDAQMSEDILVGTSAGFSSVFTYFQPTLSTTFRISTTLFSTQGFQDFFFTLYPCQSNLRIRPTKNRVNFNPVFHILVTICLINLLSNKHPKSSN